MDNPTNRVVLVTGGGIRQEVTCTWKGGPHVYDLTIEPLRNSMGAIIGVKNALLTARAGFTTVRDLGAPGSAITSAWYTSTSVFPSAATENELWPGPHCPVAALLRNTGAGDFVQAGGDARRREGDDHGWCPGPGGMMLVVNRFR